MVESWHFANLPWARLRKAGLAEEDYHHAALAAIAGCDRLLVLNLRVCCACALRLVWLISRAVWPQITLETMAQRQVQKSNLEAECETERIELLEVKGKGVSEGE